MGARPAGDSRYGLQLRRPVRRSGALRRFAGIFRAVPWTVFYPLVGPPCRNILVKSGLSWQVLALRFPVPPG